MVYLVAYDIADPRRLRRVARIVERHAVRFQKSVFLLRGDRAAVQRLFERTAPVLNLQEDVVQAWKLAGGQALLGLILGTPLYVTPAAVVLDPQAAHLVVRPEDPIEPDAASTSSGGTSDR